MQIGFIGAGKVGTGLAIAFSRAGHELAGVASRSPASAHALARRVPGAPIYDRLQDVVDRAELTFVTVGDDAIEHVVRSLQWRAGAACVHCSGAAELDVLSKAAADGALTGGFHPLHMFAAPGESVDSLPGAVIALAGPDALLGRLETLVHDIGARPFRLPPGSRALYHASANFVGGFVIALIQEALQLWERLGVSEDQARAALLPLLRSTVDNVEKFGPAGGLGSAVSRGDLGTLQKHIAALERQAPDALELYRLLSLRCIPLAVQKGTLAPQAAEALEELLRR
jgi:predicted short-subunit dehydrogenase-like oxidoreductase (DUF2520 family)